MRILMTGASGFVGIGLGDVLAHAGQDVVGVSRTVPKYLPTNCIHFQVDIQAKTDWSEHLSGVETVVHMADGFNAFEHISDPGNFADLTNETPDISKARERLAATLNLAKQALENGVKHFGYLSSIKAMCGTWSPEVLDENSVPKPDSLYGRLKLEAEQALFRMVEGREMNVTALRFPIVFGAKADGNFMRLLRFADNVWPLPFTGINAKRSMISQTSLIDAISRVVETPTGSSGHYLVHEGAMSLPEILTNMRIGLGRPTRIFSAPRLILELMIQIPKVGASASRILRPLELEDNKFRQEFSWVPPVQMEKEMQKIAAAYKG